MMKTVRLSDGDLVLLRAALVIAAKHPDYPTTDAVRDLKARLGLVYQRPDAPVAEMAAVTVLEKALKRALKEVLLETLGLPLPLVTIQNGAKIGDIRVGSDTHLYTRIDSFKVPPEMSPGDPVSVSIKVDPLLLLIKQAIDMKTGNKDFVLFYFDGEPNGEPWAAEIGNTCVHVKLGESEGEFHASGERATDAVAALIEKMNEDRV